MSNDPQDQHDDDGDDDRQVTIPRKNIRELERQAKAGKDAAARLATLERELTFRTAGIDPTDARLKYFVKGYDGELSANAIKAAAVEAGFLADPGSQGQAPPPFGAPPIGWQPQTGPSPAELAAIAQANATTAGMQAPSQAAMASYQAALAQAKSPQEIAEVVARFNLPVAGID